MTIHVEFEPEHEPQGRVAMADGSWRPFWGRLELMQRIEDALAAASDTAETGP